MRVLIQRVKHASCTVDGQVTGEIRHGLLAFVGFCESDTVQIIDKMVQKMTKLRIFEDADGKMNRSVLDEEGSVLSISQFTLYASCKKGNRPSFTQAAKAEQAARMYDLFNEALAKILPVGTGIFGADMKIELLNDGPVTIWLDSEELF
jgi:D-tyrosyl-tRNA(Tyr) deacylase